MKLKKSTRSDLITYGIVIVAFIICLLFNGSFTHKTRALLVPICCYITMAISLNLTVGILGELSLGHAGFMSIGAFSGVIVSASLQNIVTVEWVRLVIAILAGAICAAFAGFLIGIPVLRLRGDYLAIVTLAFGEIIKDIITCLIVGVDKNGIHVIFNVSGTKTINDLGLAQGGKAIIKGAQGVVGNKTISTYIAGFILILVALVIVLNFIHSRSGRAVMAIRDNSIAAESVGIQITRYKMIAFVISAALAGAAGTLFGLNFSGFDSSKFDFNTSILILVFVVLGGLGNIRGSIIATTILYILPEILRDFRDYRMLLYAVILIFVMLFTNNKTAKSLIDKAVTPFTNLFKTKKKEGVK